MAYPQIPLNITKQIALKTALILMLRNTMIFAEMKRDLIYSLILGFLLFLFFGRVGLGLYFNLGLWHINLDTAIAIGSLEAMLCSYIAYKKYKSINLGFWTGFFLGPFAIIYYLVTKPGMNEKEKEIHEWELEKKYKEMQKEKKHQ